MIDTFKLNLLQTRFIYIYKYFIQAWPIVFILNDITFSRNLNTFLNLLPPIEQFIIFVVIIHSP